MVESEKMKKLVIVDTYALLAMAFGELSDVATQTLQSIRSGRVVGVVPVTVVYEYLIHWHRGRIPALRTLEEALTFLTTYFRVENLSLVDWVKAAEIKHEGDAMLKEASDPALRVRKLSIVDSTVIVCALKLRAPILTGDRDLAYVATRFGVETIW